MKRGSFAIQRGSGGPTAVEAHSGQSFDRHSHDEYGIGVMLAGAQRSWSGRGTVEAIAGDVITVNPGEVHDGSPIGESRRWAMLYVAPGLMKTIALDIYNGDRGDVVFSNPVVRDSRAAGRFAAAYASITDREEIDAADERLTLLIAGMIDYSPRPISVACSSTARAKARIDDDPAGDHPLDALAQEVGTGRFQMLRGFARLTGLTPHAYVVQRRLDLARLMLRQGVGLADAAIGAGFADQSHFHRAFTRRYGLTPGNFAAAMR
ncbi:AraC family transcriptional regulator (plasmid) [Polymorphobacter megasporae]|nr:AraC family transcriptional regulator [Polymorphobacter sp. PAMC 29334]UAJ12919.1 AraC family transcriptional regulator [Polymorphobacter megasporae]